MADNWNDDFFADSPEQPASDSGWNDNYLQQPDDPLKKYRTTLSGSTQAAEQNNEAGFWGGVRELGRGAVRGAAVTLPEMLGKTLEYFDRPDQGGNAVNEFGQRLAQSAEERLKNNPWLQESEYGKRLSQDIWSVRGAAGQAGEMLVPSMGPALAGAGIGTAIGGPVGGLVGSLIGFGASLPLYFGQQAQDTTERAFKAFKEKGLSDIEAMDKARNVGLKTGGIEAGGELVADIIPFRLMNILPKPAKQAVIKSILSTVRSPVEMLKSLAKVELTEVGTEIGQQYGEQKVEAMAGVSPEPTAADVGSVILPTAIMSLLTFGGSEVVGGLRRRDLNNRLADPNTPEDKRVEAIQTVANQVAEVDPDLAKQFTQDAMKNVAAKRPIIVTDQDTVEMPAGPQVKPPTNFKPTHRTPEGLEVMQATEGGVPVPGLYVDASGNSVQSNNAVPLPIDPKDLVGPVSPFKLRPEDAFAGPQPQVVPRETPVPQEQMQGPFLPPNGPVQPGLMRSKLDAQTVRSDQGQVRPGGAERQPEVRPLPGEGGGNLQQSTPEAPGNGQAQGTGQAPNVPVDTGGLQAADLTEEEFNALLNEELGIKPEDQAADALAAAANEAATSPQNALPEPTDAQKEAGNYKKGHHKINGLDITIENPAGSRRRPEWNPLANHYGYIKKTEGADGEHIDTFLTDNASNPDLPVFVVDQIDPKTGKFDEHKVIMGAADVEAARKTYLDNYQPGWKGIGAITQFSLDDFKAWLKGDTTGPIADIQTVPKTETPAGERRQSAEQVAVEQRKGERRQDQATRKKVSEMSDAEKTEALLTDDLTGLKNRRAYEESDKKPFQVSIDIDSLKFINDNYGHPVGDELLRAFGQAAATATSESYHISGDEFYIQADTYAEANAVMDKLKRMAEATDVDLGDGQTLSGIGFSFGVAKTLKEAELKLAEHKKAREKAGLRAARGKAPPGLMTLKPEETFAGPQNPFTLKQEEKFAAPEIPEGERKKKSEQERKDAKLGLPSTAPELVKAFYRAIHDGSLPADNTALRGFVAEFDKVKPKDLGYGRLKEAQEALEAALVLRAKYLIGQNNEYRDAHGGDRMFDQQNFDALLSLYNMQPALNLQTSTSAQNQAYSTPAPLAYVAARLADIRYGGNQRVYEPTAGNGMLLITTRQKDDGVQANELDPKRAAMLRAIGFRNVTENDATQPNTPAQLGEWDRVIANPPFGDYEETRIDGYKLGRIEHVISARALQRMADNGRAALILAANKKAGEISGTERVFFNWLYSNYNVTSHFEVSGDLYKKQGAGWPVRLIVINGRKASEAVSPLPGQIPRIETYEQLYSTYEGIRDGTLVVPGGPGEQAPAAGGETAAGTGGTEGGGLPGPTGAQGPGTGGSGTAGEGGTAAGGPQSPAGKPGGGRSGAAGGAAGGSAGGAGGVGTGGRGAAAAGGQAGGTAGAGVAAEPGRPGVAADLNAAEFGEEEFNALLDEEIGATPEKPQPKTGQQATYIEGHGWMVPMTSASQQADAVMIEGYGMMVPTEKAATVKESLSAAASEAKAALGDAAAGLDALFGPAGTLKSGLGFDEQTYQKAKPLFKQALEHALRSADNLKDAFRTFIRNMIEAYGKKVAPYLQRFQKEVAAGDIEIRTPRQQMLDEGHDINELQSTYRGQSKSPSGTILTPANQAESTAAALEKLVELYGPIDEFVAKELGYPSVEAMYGDPAGSVLGGMQIDAVAMAIHQIKTGGALIIGDQTGVGKGRQAASIIRWANKVGKTPVFMTAKPDLYTDMFEDLEDIGSDDIQPLISNVDKAITDRRRSGKALFANPSAAKHNKVLDTIIATGELPEGRNAFFTTYDQINVEGRRRDVLRALAPDAVFILDESHKAAGDSSTGEFVRSLLELSRQAVYLSATYAKRPDNMPLYFLTDMSKAADTMDDLIDAMSRGGVPLMEMVSNQLTRSGQFIRRERSWEGISIPTYIDPDPNQQQVDEDVHDQVTERLRAIVAADLAFHAGALPAIRDRIVKEGGTINTGGGNKPSKTVNHTLFTSFVHNALAQLTMAIKADRTAALAIEAIKRGEKPVIAVNFTMGSFLQEYQQMMRLKPGDEITGFDYRVVLNRLLRRTRRISVKDKKGDDEIIEIPLEDLPASVREKYDEAMQLINDLDAADLHASPIDRIRYQIEKAGYSIKEVTGRSKRIEYTPDGKSILINVDSAEKNDRVGTVSEFNNGGLDVIIMNVAGSTGISMHAKPTFKDLRPRHMVVAQGALDINVFVQMLGRINRTGQVELPKYTIFSTSLPAEKRPQAVLSSKMKKLNANTSSNETSATSVEAVDMINKYGDEVIARYLQDNPEVDQFIGVDYDLSSDPINVTDVAKKTTGRMALLPVATQRAFYDQVEAEYQDYIEYLTENGRNDLVARTLPFDAELIEQTVLDAGSSNESALTSDAILGKYAVKEINVPPSPKEVRADIHRGLEGKTAPEHAESMIEPALAHGSAEVEPTFLAAVQKAYEDLSDEQKALAFNNGSRFSPRVEPTFFELHSPQGPKDETYNRAWRRWDNYKKTRDNIVALLRGPYKIGNLIRLKVEDETLAGVVVGIKQRWKAGDPGNPFTMSGYQINVRTNGGTGRINLPLSRVEPMRSPNTREVPADIDGLFEKASEEHGNKRTVRYIATGNLLRAYSRLEGKAEIARFTMADGRVVDGIVMPKKFNPDVDVNQQVKFPTPELAYKFLTDHQYDTDVSRFGLQTGNQSLRAAPGARLGELVLTVAGTKAKGGKWWLNKAFIELIGAEFSGTRALKNVTVPAERADAVMQYIYQTDPLYALQSMKDKATKFIAANRPAEDTKYSRIDYAEPTTGEDDVNIPRRRFITYTAVLAMMASSPFLMTKAATDTTVLGKAQAIAKGVVGVSLSDKSKRLLRAKGVNGSAKIKGVLEDLIANGPEETKALAQKIMNLLPDTGIEVEVDDTSEVNAHGAVSLKTVPKMTLYTKGIRDGLTIDTFLHESLHLTIAARYRSLSSGVVRSNDRVLNMSAPEAAKALAQFRALWEEFGQVADKNSKSVSILEAYRDPDEFFVRSLTDPAFQEYLAGLEYKGKTLWERFKDWVKYSLFGQRATGTRPSWLDAALTGSEELLDEMFKDAPNWERLKKINNIYKKSGASREDSKLSRVTGTPEQEAAIAATITPPADEVPWRQRIRNWLNDIKETDTLAIRQGLIDEFASIEALEREAFGEVQDASLSASKAARRTKNLNSVMAAVMMKGPLVYEGGAFKLKPGAKGFTEIFEPLARRGLLHLWEGWAAANRADRLMGEGREHNFTRDQIDELLKLGDEYPEFQQVLDEYQEFNRGILDLAESVGVVDPEARAIWEKNDYVPFYRVMEDAISGDLATQGPFNKRGLSGQRSGIKTLRGGEAKIGSVIENMVLNASHLIDASFKTVAMRRAVDIGTDAGVMERVEAGWQPVGIDAGQMVSALRKVGILPDVATAREIRDETGVNVGSPLSAEERNQYLKLFRRVAPAGKDIVSVMVDGKPQYYRVHDPLLLRSLTSMGTRNVDGLMKLMRGAKRLLTHAVTIDPAFMVANFLRDSLSTAVVSHSGLTPGIDAVKGFTAAMKDDPTMLAIMAGGGGGGGYYHATPEEMRTNLHHRLNAMRVKRFRESVLNTPTKLWNAWQKIGAASENANRIAIYKAVKAAGGTDAEAIHQAQDILNFSQTGDAAAMRFLIEVVPFLNARIQGLDRLWRGYQESPKSFAIKGLMITAATYAILASNWDDDEYDELPEWDKDTYWHFFVGPKDAAGHSEYHFRLPKPFEVGAIFGTVPERLARGMAGKDDQEVLFKTAARMIGDTFAMNPIPQLFKPLAEQYANRNFFTGNPIVGLSLERLLPEAQYDPWTSETMRYLGEGMPDWAPDWLRSPKRLESALRGYLGTLGMYALQASDLAIRAGGDYPSQPTPRIGDVPILKRFMRDQLPATTKYANEFYDMVEQANELYSTVKRYREEGRVEEATSLRQEGMKLLRSRKSLNRIEREITKINNAIKQVHTSRSMTPQQKRERIDQLTARKNTLLETVTRFK